MVPPFLDGTAHRGHFGGIALHVRAPLWRRVEQPRKGRGGRGRSLQPFIDLLRADAEIGETRIGKPPPQACKPAGHVLGTQFRGVEAETLGQAHDHRR